MREVRIEHDRQRDFVHVSFQGMVLETPDDVARWLAAVDEAYAPIGRPMDTIVDLGGYVVKPAAVQAYDEARLKVVARWVRRAYRYGGTSLVRTKIMTSSAINGQTANVFPTYDAALAALLRDREAERPRR